MAEVVVFVPSMRCVCGGGLLIVCWLRRLLHGHHGEFFYKLHLHLCHALLCLCRSLHIFCDCPSQRISIGEFLRGVHGCAVPLFSHCGAPRFGELSCVVFYHVDQEFVPFLPILWWPLLPLLNTFGIHPPCFCEFYQRITDEVWICQRAAFSQFGYKEELYFLDSSYHYFNRLHLVHRTA